MELPNIPKGEIITPMMYQKICVPEHYMRKYSGFGISESILSQLQREGVQLIRIIYVGKTGHRIFVASLKQFLESEKSHIFNDNDTQKFVSESEMVRVQ